jgi:methylenetetrahydrofolate reductase (NADPH)
MSVRLESSAPSTQVEAPSPRALVRALQQSSIEVSARPGVAAELGEFFLPGTEVSITFLPADDYRRNVNIAVELRRAGFTPILHVSARQLASRDELSDFVERAVGEAEARAIVLIAGDTVVPRGPFHSSLHVLETGLLQRHGIERVFLAGHPEGHSYFDIPEGVALLARKLDAARQDGLAAEIITQFCFDAEPATSFLRELDARRIAVPVRIGVAGPASPATLLKFALRCGVGESIRAVRDQVTRFGRLLTETGPDAFVSELMADARVAERVRAFHFFPFGGVRKTGRWIRNFLKG